jgi:hypothetical protein
LNLLQKHPLLVEFLKHGGFIMTRYEKQMQEMSIEGLAMLNISVLEEPMYDEDFDGYMVLCDTVLIYITSDGERFCDFDDALDYEVAWLRQECDDYE